MKMKKEDFDDLKSRMLKVMESEPESKAIYKKCGYSKERYAWDVFHAAGINITPLYEYLSDDHIKTALMMIVGEY